MTSPVVTDSLARLRESVRREPGDFIGWLLLADAEMDQGDTDASLQAAQRALSLRPLHPEALARLGHALWRTRKYPEAVAALRQAAASAPQHPGIALWLAHALEDAGEEEAAADSYARAHALLPAEPVFAAHLLSWRRKLCDWRDLDTLSQQVRAAVDESRAAIEPFAFLSEDATALEQLACARLRASEVSRHVSPMLPVPTRDGDVLRLGFISNGFGAHPTGLLTVSFFEALASMPVQTHLFATTPDDGGPIRQRLCAAVTGMHEVASLNHAAIAQSIRTASVDVLYDLRGWGGGGMPEVLARRPAPIQVNWLAYPGPSGAPWIDYVLADKFVLPVNATAGFSEQVAWLPRCFQPSDTKREMITPPSRQACGLPETGVVFACFNNSYKLNPPSFARMLAVVKGVPGSVLWLLSGPGRADARLREAAQTAGVQPTRLVFMQKQPHADYLSRYRHVDLFLDTHPYNAHTTASDALWAGCPVLTCPGQTFASRVAGSLNHHLGLAGMNAPDVESYIRTAQALGNQPTSLAALREQLHLAKQQSGLFDMPGFAEDFLKAAHVMVRRHRQHQVPQSFG